MEQQELGEGLGEPDKAKPQLPDAEPVAPEAKLRLVEQQTGEFTEHVCPGCLEREAEIKKLTTDSRSWHRRYLAAVEDNEAKARDHELWPKALTLWAEWKIATGRERSKWSGDRFWLCQPYLEKDGFVVCRWAVWGVAYEPNSRQLPSGLVEVYNDWELLFRNRSTFERYAKRGWANPEARAQFDLREQGIDPKWLDEAGKGLGK